MKGLLVVISGLDCAGKSTQIELLMDYLGEVEGQKPICLWTRGGYTPVLEKLKAVLRRLPGRTIPPAGGNPDRTRALEKTWVRRLWLIFALVDLVWVYCLQLRWWRWRGKTVICDRYLCDTLIDFRLNFPMERVEAWWLWRILSVLAPNPDVALLLTIPVEESIRRSDHKGEPFPDPPHVLEDRLSQYQLLAQQGHYHVLDGQRSIDELFKEIQGRLQAACPRNAPLSA